MTRSVYLRELRAWSALAATSAAGWLMGSLPDLISLFFLGRLGTVTLASVSLAGNFAYSIGATFSVGLSLGHGALASQATGSQSYTALFGWSFLLLCGGLLCSVVILPVFLTGHLILGLFNLPGIDLEIVRQFLWWSAPVTLFNPIYSAACGHLAAIQRLVPVLAIESSATLLNAFANWGLIFGLGLGVRGAALADVVSSVTAALTGIAAMYFLSKPPIPEEEEEEEEEEEGEGEKEEDSSTKEDEAAREDEGPHARLLVNGGEGDESIPSSTPSTTPTLTHQEVLERHAKALGSLRWRSILRFATHPAKLRTFATQAGSASLSMALEIGTDLVLVILAARIGLVEAAVSNCLVAILDVLLSVTIGGFEATSIRIGNALGGMQVGGAVRVGWVGGGVLGAWVVIISGLLVGGRGVLGWAFSSDSRVLAGVSALAPWLAARHAAIVTYIHLCSILDGQGRAELYVALSLVVAVIQVPLSVLSITHTGWGLTGLWASSTIAYAAAAVFAAVLLARSDWKSLAVQAVERSKEEEEEEEEEEGEVEGEGGE